MPRSVPTLALLIALATNLALGAEILITKPPAICPKTDLGDAEFQTHYDEMWQMFTSAVAETSDDLAKALNDLKKRAQDDGNLDLALHWNEQLESFKNSGSVKWDSAGDNKKSWKERFKDTPFPDDFATTLATIKTGYDKATEALNDSYGELVKKITMSGDLLKAKKVKDEGRAVLAGQPVPPSPDPKKPDTGQRPLAQRLLGKWTHPNRGEERFFDADGTFRQVAVKGGENVPPLKVTTDNEKATCVLPNRAFFHAWLINDDLLAFVYLSVDGKPINDGEVWYRTGRVADPDPSKKRPSVRELLIANKWIHANDFRYLFRPDGTFVLEGTPRHGSFCVTSDDKFVVLRWHNENVLSTIAVGETLADWVMNDFRPFRPITNNSKAPKEATAFGGHRYMFVPAKISWEDAKRKCEEMGGHLVTIGSQEENTFVFKLTQGKPCWIGLVADQPKAIRVWITGEPVAFTKWRTKAGQPNGLGDPYASIGCVGTDEWDDFNPDRGGFQNFICEWE